MKVIRSLFARATRNPWQWAVLLGVGLIYLVPILSVPGLAAVFIKIGDIAGESTDDKHKDWINLDSVNWEVSRTITTGGAGGGRDTSAAKPSEIQVGKYIDKASPKLMLSAASGEAIPEVTLHFTRSDPTGGEQTYYTITLSDVLVSSFSSASGGSGDAVPTESISLNYTKIQMSYTPTDKGGLPGPAVEAGYDFENNRPQ